MGQYGGDLSVKLHIYILTFMDRQVLNSILVHLNLFNMMHLGDKESVIISSCYC